ncbi:MAG: hypothetical protein U0326_32685 [Polyangiales bacterium]
MKFQPGACWREGAARVAVLVVCASVTLPACGARTGLGDDPYVIDALMCQETPFRARPGIATTLYVTLPRAAIGRAQWEVTARPAGAAPPTLVHHGGTTASFLASTEGTYEIRVTVPGEDGGAASSCVTRVIVRAMGPVALCPAEVTTTPLRAVGVVARAQGDRPITTYRWTLEGAPATSGRPSPRPADSAVTSYTPDVAGDYTLRLQVTDAANMVDACATIVHAVPREGLRVELVWDPPGRTCPRSEGAACDGSDVDLHLLRESGAAMPWRSDDDCHWFNCNASAGRSLQWGLTGVTDNPRLDIDDVTGHGPENINIDRPSARAYRVGVHYFDAHGAGPEAATVVIYCGSPVPVARIGPVTLSYRGAADTSDFWLVADVVPASPGGCEVRPIRRGSDPWIMSYFEAQRGAGPPAP